MKQSKLLLPFLYMMLVGLWGGISISNTHAQTVEELQAQIQSLLQTISSLQAQINIIAENSTPSGVSFVFTRDLSIGDTGEDVRALQKILNQKLSQRTKTRVAVSGPGSPGNETDFFGTLTQSAVIRFQNLYAQEILAPVGISTGTGFVGASTRAKLNTLAIPADTSETSENPATPPKLPVAEVIPAIPEPIAEVIPDVTEIIPTIPKPAAESITVSAESYPDVNIGEVAVNFIAPTFGPPNTIITIFGEGFTRKSNVLHIGDRYFIRNILSSSSTELTFNMPNAVPAGKYALSISNEYGTSSAYKTFLVTDKAVQSPVISDVSPASGPYGTEVTVIGDNFSLKGNDIYTSYGIIENIASSDGKTLSFKILPAPEVPELQVGVDLNKGIEWPIWFYIVSEGGESDESNPGSFILRI
ncbi:MAG: hypothetical protein COW88_02210 [Candidatus Lloydbacteria bacterium CG22_combo_CG10-13_8_21_14_all_47_15]|uniref:IPT/TIG domain-containing protein n=1 Tax=Candidatus Lloydbacteria bacterium CG22_combo_CG10-13_8_21_14_all_47_15 TaxID=1974635 RepID=A0A2H0CUL3_9BACT|nr:MAG: hypothetical protein COW88_02210 [Candidatus Lloydbacteria bacterium CG22_combo_CG10-13_8_21_14_all_47_15]